VTPPLHSPLHEDLRSLGDIFSRQSRDLRQCASAKMAPDRNRAVDQPAIAAPPCTGIS
jgi:hypothetical protein